LPFLIYVFVQPHVLVEYQKLRFTELGRERQVGKAVQRQIEALQSGFDAPAAFIKMTDAFAYPVRLTRKEGVRQRLLSDIADGSIDQRA
jgi:hypothetical protein